MEADVVIIGSGPAGLQAAIHAARKKVSTVLIGKLENSSTFEIPVENYFGTPGKQSGTELLMNGVRQAVSFGCEVEDMNMVSAERKGDRFMVTAESGVVVEAKAVVLATGITRNTLGVPGEKEFGNGKGVSYCASCDCNFYKGKAVAVVGGQSEAAISAELMTRYASKVYWVFSKLDADISLVEKAVSAGAERIEVPVKQIKGDDRVRSILLSDGNEVPVDGVFIELGGKSSVDLAMDLGIMPEMDDSVKVDRGCATSVPGVFACGDITGRPWQIGKAVGEGVVAGSAAADYAKKVGQ